MTKTQTVHPAFAIMAPDNTIKMVRLGKRDAVIKAWRREHETQRYYADNTGMVRQKTDWPKGWDYWLKKGYKVVAVTVTVEA